MAGSWSDGTPRLDSDRRAPERRRDVIRRNAEVGKLRREVDYLAGELEWMRDRLLRVTESFAPAGPCSDNAIGHTYEYPDEVIRNRILKHGWAIARICLRCGYDDGPWGDEHLPTVSEHRRFELPANRNVRELGGE